MLIGGMGTSDAQKQVKKFSSDVGGETVYSRYVDCGRHVAKNEVSEGTRMGKERKTSKEWPVV
jgi:hypothetical protein